MNDLIREWGAPGVIVVALSCYILLIEKRHREERKEWSESNNRLTNETNANLKENNNILSGLKALFEITLRK